MNYIINMFRPNEYMSNILIRFFIFIRSFKSYACIFSILFVPIIALLSIWYIVTLLDDLSDFIWFKYLDMCISMPILK